MVATPFAAGAAGILGPPAGRGPTMSEDAVRFELLADLGAMIAREVELDVLLDAFADKVAHALRADRATLWLLDGATGALRARVAVLPEAIGLPEVRLEQGLVGHVAATGTTLNIADAARDPRWSAEIDRRTGYRTVSVLAVPVTCRRQVRGVLQVLNKQAGAFTHADEDFARALADQIGRALDYTSLRGDDDKRGVTLRGRINHVIGQSPGMMAVYDLAMRAARSDATVLIHGETGTGKGVIARAIHVNSQRQGAPFVHVDCTTLPANLVESELFGHERGAYTGADSRVIGKVEAAAGGTLFLDEVGELPIELQGKFLRFVQERRFERVGGRETLTADVRIVAATNRDLPAMAAAGTFRSDLYYRLRVVEVELPPLRERGGDDVLALAEHFADQYARKYRRGPVRFADRARTLIAAHTWPGNVRELEHAVERAVVLSRDGELDADELGLIRPAGARRTTGGIPIVRLEPPGPGPAESGPAPAVGDDGVHLPPDLALDEAERRYALAILTRCGGNQSAAARQLGISRNKLARLLRER
ncbi:MAG: sigma-54-dependent Fis family transcriptional regulator [Kofleriaceae bacterium]|jgi:transcriptional regulator with GAF, ATPase, and Fis domain|nr:sigma-54-dependent Fis family transcriptional regulator [Kofleriaceae bacterium]MBP6836174.1 sigma-54-dependent Fis family transcriptional regulator [Kofleriaceae bacterium]MBP9206372.1 sigma-54-dependent Fis family transcriptional regulator [Kofleriaceae bacterium]